MLVGSNGVTVVGPLGAVFAGDETKRVCPRLPSVGLIHHCSWEITNMDVVAVVREARHNGDCPLIAPQTCGPRTSLFASEVEGTPNQEIGFPAVSWTTAVRYH